MVAESQGAFLNFISNKHPYHELCAPFALQVTTFQCCAVAPDAALIGCTFVFD